MSRRRREDHKSGSWGLPSTLAGANHLGKQLDRKRREATRRLAAEAKSEPDVSASAQKASTDRDGASPRERSAHKRSAAPRPLPAPDALDAWLNARGFAPFVFQRETWAHFSAGRSGLLHATTGSGKTYAAWLGALRRELERGASAMPTTRHLKALWITPMRALAADTTRALADVATGIGLDWEVGMRTGDTDAAQRARQAKSLPEALVTTPESLTLFLARADARALLGSVGVVIVDEWHELMGNKRGVQTQLALAHLRLWNPKLIVWGLSATLGNLRVARDVLLGFDAKGKRRSGVMVEGDGVNDLAKEIVIDTLIPDAIERFPWGGHLGTRLVDAVVAEIEKSSTTLVFTNVRSQAEIWYQTLLAARPDWAGVIALHHGSLAREVREWVEAGLKSGALKAVVCTASLDLGVDFLPVERVLQIGSAKGVARLMQRAGRSGHAPGRASRATLVPTNALELVEAAAARRAVAARKIEPRAPPDKPLDCLVQHMVTIALGGGFIADELFAEVRCAWSYRELTRDEFDWCLAFVEGGGASLAAYPDHHRIAKDEHGVYRVPRADLARRHRMSIGTIVSESAMHVAWLATGRKLGQIEESFIARLKPGDAFVFGGRVLELVRVRDMTAYVTKAAKKKGVVPAWAGSRMSLSSELADASLAMLHRAAKASDAWFRNEPEMRAVRPLLRLQQQWSALPETGKLVIELIASREGHHFVCYPFAGRVVHIGLGSLLAWRAAREKPGTFSISMNDYGFELLSAEPFDWEALIASGLFSTDDLLPDVLASLNASELAQRRFREIARVAGLVFSGYPGAQKSTRQVQASSSLFYEVFRKHDAGNLLLSQAESEALAQELEIDRLRTTLARMNAWRHVVTRPGRVTPFAFPLMVERFREEVTTEKLGERIKRMLAELEEAAESSVLYRRGQSDNGAAALTQRTGIK